MNLSVVTTPHTLYEGFPVTAHAILFYSLLSVQIKLLKYCTCNERVSYNTEILYSMTYTVIQKDTRAA